MQQRCPVHRKRFHWAQEMSLLEKGAWVSSTKLSWFQKPCEINTSKPDEAKEVTQIHDQLPGWDQESIKPQLSRSRLGQEEMCSGEWCSTKVPCQGWELCGAAEVDGKTTSEKCITNQKACI